VRGHVVTKPPTTFLGQFGERRGKLRSQKNEGADDSTPPSPDLSLHSHSRLHTAPLTTLKITTRLCTEYYFIWYELVLARLPVPHLVQVVNTSDRDQVTEARN
jgi:hypothetical protein